MDQVAAPAPLHAVPLQAVPPPAAISTAAPVALIQDGSQAAGHGGNAQDYSRVMQQLKWMEKMIFVCIFLALYAIFKKQFVYVCVSGSMSGPSVRLSH